MQHENNTDHREKAAAAAAIWSLILVGLNDEHIHTAMADDRITFIIPWHSSGNYKDTLATMLSAVQETLDTSEAQNYEKVQNDKFREDRTDEQRRLWDLRMGILTGQYRDGISKADLQIIQGNDWLNDLYNRFYVDQNAADTYGVRLTKEQASQIFPYEYWDTSSTIENADVNGQRFVKYCEQFGIRPRFEQFSNDPGYWKLLIDRNMYGLDGKYHKPKAINVTNLDIDGRETPNMLGDVPLEVKNTSSKGNA